MNVPIWENGKWTPLGPLKNDAECDVCVIGLGASGLTAAKVLRQNGLSVIGIDAIDVAAGAAGRNGGFLLAGMADFYHDVVQAVGRTEAKKRYLETLDSLKQVFKDFPDCSRQCGSLRIAADTKELEDCRIQYETMLADDLPVEWYKGPEGEGLIVPTDGSFNPLTRARTLANRVMDSGVKLYGQTKAVSI